MLTWIHLSDFLLVDRLELEFPPGMTALTGETGAGKSILLDAIGLALGDRAEAGVIRPGAERAEIQLGFDLSEHPGARAWLAEHDLLENDGSECQLRRVISREGRSRAWINGSPCPMGLLRELGERLVAIHGQHAHQSLLQREIQRQLLDRQARAGEQLQEMAEAHARWQDASRRLEHLRTHAHEIRQRIEFLRFQLDELEALSPQPGEQEALQAEARRLGAAGELQGLCARLVASLYEDEDSAWSRVSSALDEVSRAGEEDAEFATAAGLLADAAAPLEDAVALLRRLGDRLEPDPERLDEVNARLAELQRLARKHAVDIDALPELARSLREELASLEGDHGDLDRLETEVGRLHAAAKDAAERLHALRVETARDLEPRIEALLAELGLREARFRIRIDSDSRRLSPHGMDRVEFEVRTHPELPWGALSKIASGGELSRIGLALAVVLGDAGSARVRIFDEVDAGIGGGVAEVVGRHLRELSGTGQVLCVTHLPQVAAQAHHHLQVEKRRGKSGILTRIRHLSNEERVEELARMLGGLRITRSTREHAREMLERATSSPSGSRTPVADNRRRGSGSGRG